MITRLARFLRDARGVAAIEAALLFPVLLLMIAGIAEYSRLLLAHHMMRDILDDQGRMAAVRGLSAAEVADNLDAAILTVPGIGTPTVEVDAGAALLTLTVSGSFQLYFGNILPDRLIDFSLSARYPR